MDDSASTLRLLLIRDLHQGFWQLVERYQQPLYRFALRLAGNAHEAEDLVQEALMGAYVTLSCYPPERIQTLLLRPWLYKILLNAFRNTRRSQHMLVISLERQEAYLQQEMTESDLEERYEIREELEQLQRFLADLPEAYRLVVICFFFEEFSYQEIAHLLEIPIGTVKSRLHRGLQLLRSRRRTLQEQRRHKYGAC
jgi:RNA polymerase sigma-70 factor (ECF subfamily)